MILRSGVVAQFFVLTSIAIVLIFYAWRTRTGKAPHIRVPPAVKALPEIVGRCTETNRPIHYTLGKIGLIGGWTPLGPITNQASFTVLEELARLAAKYDAKLIATITASETYLVEHEIIESAYRAAGKPDKPVDVRFLSPYTLSYAMAVMGIMHREHVGANVVIGLLGEETLLFAETGVEVGALQVGGSPSLTIFHFLMCEYYMFGEDVFAAGAAISNDPVLVSGLAASDTIKVGIIATILLGSILALSGSAWLSNLTKL